LCDDTRDAQQSRREFVAAEHETVHDDFLENLINGMSFVRSIYIYSETILILEIQEEEEEEDIDQDDQSPVGVQTAETLSESVAARDGSDLGRKNKTISPIKSICFSLFVIQPLVSMKAM
jgi:hypothetical protein